MSVSEIFIKRRIMTSLVMLAVLMFGSAAYLKLPVNDLPNVDYPTIQVRAELPGANPDTMASAVATPLERQFSTIAGVDSMSSTNGQGLSIITLKFALERSIDAAAQDVQSAIAAAARQLPPTMPTPLSFRKVNPADQPVIYLALSSPSLPLSQVHEYAVTISFNIKPGVPLGAATAAVKKMAAASLPVKITTAFQGTAQAFQQSTKGLPCC